MDTLNPLPIPRTRQGRCKRSSKYDDCRHAAIVESLRHGCTRKAASEAAGINVSTFGKWMEQFSAFNSDVLRAEAEWEEETVCAIQLAATPHDVEIIKQIYGEDGRLVREERHIKREHDWQAAAWLLSRRRPADYGKQAEATMPVVVNVNVDAALLKIYGPQAALSAHTPEPVEIEGEIVAEQDPE